MIAWKVVSFHGVRSLAPQVGVSVLCPGFVRTRIIENARECGAGREVRPDLAAQEESFREMIAESTPPGLRISEIATTSPLSSRIVI